MDYEKLKTKNLYPDLSHTLAKGLLEKTEYPWLALEERKSFIIAVGKALPEDEFTPIDDNFWIGRGVSISPTAELNGPAIIDSGTVIRPGAFIRGSV